MGGWNHYSKYYNNFNWCHSPCPLYRGCPLVGVSIIGGSTVARNFRGVKTSWMAYHKQFRG